MPSTTSSTSPLTASPEALERLARRRAGMRLGWIIHATVYLAVNLLLVGLSLAAGRHWAIFPLLGWGLGLAIHGAVVYLSLDGSGLHARLVQQERERLQTSGR